jgi:hypothetical protein
MAGSAASGSAEGTGEQLFVINLCAAMTPIDLNSQTLADLNQYKLYQVSRMEDGRRRYRLRLGFFPTVALAEDVLASVRARYATAFTSCLCQEDLKHATGYLKCSVKDLERTGRYSVLKLRGDSGGTTALRVLTPATIAQFQAAEARAAEPAPRTATAPGKSGTPVVSVLPIRVPPTQRSAPLNAAPRNVAPPTTPAIERRQPGSPLRGAPAPKITNGAPPAQPVGADQTQSLKAMIMAPANSPKRESLMRQAHAMATVDAVERAKAIPGAAASEFVDVLATGKFKQAPQRPAQTNAAQTPANPAAPKAPAIPAAPVARAATPPVVKTAPQIPVARKPAAPSVLEAHTPPAHVAAPVVQKSNKPFHVGAGVVIPESALTLETSEPARTATTTRISPILAPAAGHSTTTDLLRARELAKQSAQWRQDNGEVPTLDTTQTIRTLTKNELEDANRPKWFTVQLAISAHPANLDTMPHLDIFEAYSLYSVAVMEGTGIRHALRLGFFREEVSAEAVMGYLRTFFNEPVIVRIPDAEHDRFIDAPKIGTLAKPTTNNVLLDEKHAAKHAPISSTVPTVSAAVERSPMTKPAPRAAPEQQSKPMARSAAPATKRAPATATPAANKKPTTRSGYAVDPNQQQLLEEARLLGLTDTAILRVQKNPSLLTRLVGKLGK